MGLMNWVKWDKCATSVSTSSSLVKWNDWYQFSSRSLNCNKYKYSVRKCYAPNSVPSSSSPLSPSPHSQSCRSKLLPILFSAIYCDSSRRLLVGIITWQWRDWWRGGCDCPSRHLFRRELLPIKGTANIGLVIWFRLYCGTKRWQLRFQQLFMID